MKLFADTANLEEIKELHQMGVISGVTTNPSIVSKEPKQNYADLIRSLATYCSDNDLSLSVEVFETEPSKMLVQTVALYDSIKALGAHSNLNIKIPVGVEELKVVTALRKKGIRVNCTACFTEMQLQAAFLANANYVSLFYNRARDAGVDIDRALLRANRLIGGKPCEIIAGSIRSPQDVSDAWASGAHIVTCSPKIIKEMTKHSGTTASVEGFTKDFATWIGKQ